MGIWQVDPAHSAVEFQVKHMMIATVKGRFAAFQGTLEVDETGPKVRGTIDVASIDTHEAHRDEHLRSPDFFDAATYPEIRFESTMMERVNKRVFTIVGNLTIRGVTRPIELEAAVQGSAHDSSGAERIAFEARGELDRTDFGLNWNQVLETGGVVVGAKVKILVNVAAVKAAAAVAT
jgi:polyisoprenoid-binding protein YceI